MGNSFGVVFITTCKDNIVHPLFIISDREKWSVNSLGHLFLLHKDLFAKDDGGCNLEFEEDVLSSAFCAYK